MEPETILQKSGLTAMDVIPSVCPSKTKQSPVKTSHNRTVVSLDPDTTNLLSGLKLTEFTEFVCPLNIVTACVVRNHTRNV